MRRFLFLNFLFMLISFVTEVPHKETIDLQWKPMDWFLYDTDLRNERVKFACLSISLYDLFCADEFLSGERRITFGIGALIYKVELM